MIFSHDPAYPPPSFNSSNAWRSKTYVLSSVPLRKPRTIIDDASDFLSSAIAAPLSLWSGGSPQAQATPDEVFNGAIDLNEDEILEEERGEEAEVDDSPELGRSVRMLTLVNKTLDDWELVGKAKKRRQWQITPLRTANARTGA